MDIGGNMGELQLCSKCGKPTGWRIKNGSLPEGFYPLCECCATVEKGKLLNDIRYKE